MEKEGRVTVGVKELALKEKLGCLILLAVVVVLGYWAINSWIGPSDLTEILYQFQ